MNKSGNNFEMMFPSVPSRARINKELEVPLIRHLSEGAIGLVAELILVSFNQPSRNYERILEFRSRPIMRTELAEYAQAKVVGQLAVIPQGIGYITVVLQPIWD